jgi:signal transduction histidine kinase
MKRTLQQSEDESAQAMQPPGVGDARSHHGSLRSKLVLSLAAIFILFLLLDEIVRRHVIEPQFANLEQARAVRDARRVLATFDSEVEHLAVLTRHWASQLTGSQPSGGDLTPDHAEAGSPAPERSYWVARTAPETGWTWIQTGPASRGSAAHQSAPHGSGPHDVPTHLSVAQMQSDLQRLLRPQSRSGEPWARGMTRIGDHQLALFAVAPTRKRAASAGTNEELLVVARVVDEILLQDIRRQTQVNFLIRPSGRTAPRHSPTVNAGESQGSPPIDGAMLAIEVPLTAVDGEKLANVCVRVPRDITARSNHTSALAKNSFILGSIAALLMLLVLLQRIVISPLAAIREHSNRVAEEGFSTEPMLLQRDDEIGQLAGAFDDMVRKLSDTQTQLGRASQAAGRSQVASNVIHNVGNVLTNVNSLLEAANLGIEGLRIGPLDKLADRLRTDCGNQMLLSAIPDYLEGLAGSLKTDQDSILELLAALHDNIRHIHDVIRDQQRHTDPSIKSTRICLKDIIEEAITCCRARLDEDSISVEAAGDLMTTVYSDRSLLLQTMINIIGNAQQALREVKNRPRSLSIEVTRQEENVLIIFRDTGCGMTNDTMQRVFDAHFTTRENGTGLGLHFCALTLKRLGGSISVFSDGLECGATFVVELPNDSRCQPAIDVYLQAAPTNLSMTTS